LRRRCTCWWPARRAAAAQAAAQIAGVSKVIHADAPASRTALAENVAAQVLAIASNYSHILFPATAGGKNVAPRVAAKLDVAQISDITKVDSADTFERPIYAATPSPPCKALMPSRSSPCVPPASTLQRRHGWRAAWKRWPLWPIRARAASWAAK
jgi:electron transfer flavoprotein alpha subunit